MLHDATAPIRKPDPDDGAALAAMSTLFSREIVISEKHNAFVWLGHISDADVASLGALLPRRVTDLSAEFERSNRRRAAVAMTPRSHSHTEISDIESIS